MLQRQISLVLTTGLKTDPAMSCLGEEMNDTSYLDNKTRIMIGDGI